MKDRETKAGKDLFAAMKWFIYFRSNRNILERYRPENGRKLRDDEQLRIADSIRQFQLGESSEGRNLSRFAKCHSERTGDNFYHETIKLFIREEQRHAQILGWFMEREGITKLKRCFIDSVFRYLRCYLGLEVSITVLLMAEIISLIYYRALRAATDSKCLKEICDELLKDERKHLRFHGEKLMDLCRFYGSFHRLIRDLFQVLLLSGTCLAVWVNHRSVLLSRGSFVKFWRMVWHIYTAFRARTKGRSKAQDRPQEMNLTIKSVEWGG